MTTPPIRKKWLVLDLDGVLSDNSHRLGAAQARDWQTYEELAKLDTPGEAAKQLFYRWEDSGGHILILTGRSNARREQTRLWLQENELVPDELLMRPENMWVADGEMKVQMLDEHFGDRESALRSVALIVDDTESVVAALRNAGFPVWHAG
jgi:phosphoglycolate phosphatase-like HAD superfamily hydrolase